MIRLVPMAVGAAAALWWWEVLLGGQLPAVAVGQHPGGELVWRWAGHAVLFSLLAAATWVDFRERVIPDWITVPGVLLGLVWAAALPDTLPPIAREVPRSFAAPLLESDVLGLSGGLRAAVLPAWLGPRPALTGLAAALVVFGGWWSFCTVAWHATGWEPWGVRPALPGPSWLVLAGGIAGIAAAWSRGGDHWAGLLTALAGLAVAASIVWLTRFGASQALGQEAMGFGDVTLMAMVGAWLGWQPAVLVCCLGVAIGLVHGLVQLVSNRGNELPFGPSLCLAAVIVVLLWRPVWERAGPHFERPIELALVVGAVIALTGLGLAGWAWLRRRGVAG